MPLRSFISFFFSGLPPPSPPAEAAVAVGGGGAAVAPPPAAFSPTINGCCQYTKLAILYIYIYLLNIISKIEIELIKVINITMVKVCDTSYPPDTPYNDIFKQYPFSLSDFQKYGLQAIEEDKHILITAHTGSGKTLPAEYAIKHFCKKGKKVIYTAPIKSLSNQKFHEFSKKYPDISFGILTGDIKFNPEADCLIMTTEILRNTLFQQKMIDEEIISKEQLSLHFNIDIQQDLGCVIFDEIHYINDRDRGKVWEETIMMLPKHILLVMLSATMDKAEKFASWIEEVTQKEVWWAPTTQRVVPLTHYAFLTLRSSLSNQHANTLMDTHLHSPLLLKHHHDKFEDKNYHDLAKIKHYFQKNRIFVNHSFVLNTIVKYLHEHNLLPAICFVFSRRKTEEYARQISLSLNDAKTMNIIENECSTNPH